MQQALKSISTKKAAWLRLFFVCFKASGQREINVQILVFVLRLSGLSDQMLPLILKEHHGTASMIEISCQILFSIYIYI